jgi:hypothetical protein
MLTLANGMAKNISTGKTLSSRLLKIPNLSASMVIIN